MIVVDSKDVSKVTVGTPPQQRFARILLSPKLQPEVSDIALGLAVVPAGNATSPHMHPDLAETFYVLSGRAEIRVGGESVIAGPDTVAYGPAGIEHQVLNAGDDELRFVFIYTPPGAEEPVLASLGIV
ncbi:MAG: hypothetical protein A2147_09360 [Chloroflexi bacterium RBG_16_57_8]|nr:MAG: hypothetical protein A2147_09360 [Chloroflexi bacterium RBG_16_57_8]